MSVPRSCREAVDLLWEYVEGDLAQPDRTTVDRHLAHCLRCCGEVVFVRELHQRLAGPPPELPDDVESRLEAFLDQLEPTSEGTP